MIFSRVVIAYLVTGLVMWGGGVISWSDVGVASLVVSFGDGVAPNQELVSSMQSVSGPVRQALNTVGGGGLVAILDLVMSLVGFLFWPLVVLNGVNAPPRIALLLGATLTTAFFVSFIRMIRG